MSSIQIFSNILYILYLKGGVSMQEKEEKEKIVEKYSNKEKTDVQKPSVEPLPESTRPRQDGPGGN